MVAGVEDMQAPDTQQEARMALLLGCCVGLGWDGLGQPPRGVRREAVRLLDKAKARQEKAK